MGSRRLSRELALQFLYQLDVLREGVKGNIDVDEYIDQFWRDRGFRVGEDVKEFANVLARGVCDSVDTIDSIIGRFSEHWKVERMPKIDRNILRMGVYELLYLRSIPPAVTINEAIDLAKKYGSEESGRFVNGILDKIRQALFKGEIEHDKGIDI